LHLDGERSVAAIRSDLASERPGPLTGLGQLLEIADITDDGIARPRLASQGQGVRPAAAVESAGDDR